MKKSNIHVQKTYPSVPIETFRGTVHCKQGAIYLSHLNDDVESKRVIKALNGGKDEWPPYFNYLNWIYFSRAVPMKSERSLAVIFTG